MWSHVGDPAPTGKPVFVDFAAAAVYPPVPYVPSAIGIRIGRLFRRVAVHARVARRGSADLAAFIALVALAIRRLPTPVVLAILALTPVRCSRRRPCRPT